jgi:hypothetical protein
MSARYAQATPLLVRGGGTSARQSRTCRPNAWS